MSHNKALNDLLKFMLKEAERRLREEHPRMPEGTVQNCIEELREGMEGRSGVEVDKHWMLV